MLDKNPQVLIVGAGPTGLLMACQLALFGIPFRIIEKNSHPTQESRALGIQARTLEMFAQMGIAEEFTKLGEPAIATNYIVGKIHRRISLENIGEGLSAFPYLLILEQSKTEEILIEFLQKHHIEINWSTELTQLAEENDGVTCKIKTSEGKSKEFKVDYVVGADGAHSAVRHALGIPLAGATYQQELFVLDCHVSSELFKSNEIYLTLSNGQFNAFFPLPHHAWRVIGIVPENLQTKDHITFEEINQHFSERVSFPVTLSQPNWISIYHSHHRCVKTFRAERCFLAGDAAHIHSPVGAQGMNTGLQDAYNLSWKLAFVLQGKAQESLLDTYNIERLAFAKKLVYTTDRVFNLVVSENIIKTVFTRYIAPILMQEAVRIPFFRKFIFTTISQIGISYKNSPLSRHASFGKFPNNTPLPGMRLPYILFTDDKGKTKNIQEYSLSTKMELLVFGDENFFHQLDEIVAKKSDSMHITHIAKTNATKHLYTLFGIASEGCFVVRPDMYIAYRSQGINKKHFMTYLTRLLKNTS